MNVSENCGSTCTDKLLNKEVTNVYFEEVYFEFSIYKLCHIKKNYLIFLYLNFLIYKVVKIIISAVWRMGFNQEYMHIDICGNILI